LISLVNLVASRRS